MGLLNKLSESGLVKEEPKPVALDKPLEKKSNTVGLLKKSLDLASNEDRLDFFKFIHKYNLELCAVFNYQNGVYCVENSAGLDGESICHSISTEDFWDGISEDDNGKTLPFYQFFSQKIKDKITKLNFYKKSDGRIFLYSADNYLPNTFYSDIESLTEACFNFYPNKYPLKTKESVQYYTIDFSEAIESLVFSLTKSSEKDRLIKAIIYQIHFNLLQNFPSPNRVISSDNGIFKVAFFVDQETPFEVISNHIRFESEFVLDNHSELLSIERCENFFEAE